MVLRLAYLGITNAFALWTHRTTLSSLDSASDDLPRSALARPDCARVSAVAAGATAVPWPAGPTRVAALALAPASSRTALRAGPREAVGRAHAWPALASPAPAARHTVPRRS